MHACMYVCMYAWVRGYQSGPGIATESIFRAPRRAQQCHQTNRDLRVRMNSYTYVCMTKQPSSTRTSYNQHLAALQMHRRTVLRSRQSPIRTWLVNCLHLRLQLQTRYCCSVVEHPPPSPLRFSAVPSNTSLLPARPGRTSNCLIPVMFFLCGAHYPRTLARSPKASKYSTPVFQPSTPFHRFCICRLHRPCL